MPFRSISIHVVFFHFQGAYLRLVRLLAGQVEQCDNEAETTKNGYRQVFHGMACLTAGVFPKIKIFAEYHFK